MKVLIVLLVFLALYLPIRVILLMSKCLSAAKKVSREREVPYVEALTQIRNALRRYRIDLMKFLRDPIGVQIKVQDKSGKHLKYASQKEYLAFTHIGFQELFVPVDQLENGQTITLKELPKRNSGVDIGFYRILQTWGIFDLLSKLLFRKHRLLGSPDDLRVGDLLMWYPNEDSSIYGWEMQAAIILEDNQLVQISDSKMQGQEITVSYDSAYFLDLMKEHKIYVFNPKQLRETMEYAFRGY